MVHYQTFAVPRLIIWNGIAITDHNRQPVSVSFDRLENRQRMANGQLRVQTVAQKAKWDFSWTDIPSNTLNTVDGLGGGFTILGLGNSTVPFVQTLYYNGGMVQTNTVMPSEVSYSVKKRGPNTDLWDISVSLEEV